MLPIAPPSWRLMLIVLVMLAIASPLHGQGTSGTLPDPISGDDLTAYSRRLGLSEEQRLAVDTFHSDYLADFNVLREREIDEFLRETGQLMRSFMFSPDSKKVRATLSDYDRLLGRITTLDDRLFNQMQGMLSEEQMTLVPRARQMRERARYRTGMVRMITFRNPGARVDLSEIVELVRLDDADRVSIDPPLQEYETQLTNATRRLSETSTSMFVDAVKQVEELNLEANGRNWQAISQVWQDASSGAVARASDISALNRRTVRSLGPFLSEPGRRTLTDSFRELAYPDVYKGMAPTLGLYDSALAMTGLPDDTRASIEAAGRALRDQHERLAEQIIDVLEEQRKSSSMFRWGQRPPVNDDLEQLRERRTELNERATESLFAMLGAKRSEALRDRAANADELAKESAATLVFATNGGTSVVAARVDTATSGSSAGPDTYIPGPISAEDVMSMAERLGVDEGRTAVLQSLHDDYLDAYETVRTEQIEPIIEMRRRLWDKKNDETPGPTPANVDTLFDMRRAAVDGVTTLDDTFFDDVALTVLDRDDDAGQALIPRLANERRRDVYTATSASARRTGMPGQRRFSRSWMMQDNTEALVDLGRIVRDAPLTDEERGRIEPTIIAYENEMNDRFRLRFETGFELDRGMERLNTATQGEGGQRSSWRAYRDLIQTTGQTLSETESAISSANRQALEQLRSTLSAGSFGLVEDDYRRRAYPQVFDDPSAAEPLLLAALDLDDLSDSQRELISDILAEYRAPYRTLCLRMVDVHAAALDASDEDQRSRWQRRGERRNELEKLEFDRGELSDKSLRRLRAALRDEQTQRIGLAAEDA